jgi:hypothetical protein
MIFKSNEDLPSTSSGETVAVSKRRSNFDFLSIGRSREGTEAGDGEREPAAEEREDARWHLRRFTIVKVNESMRTKVKSGFL